MITIKLKDYTKYPTGRFKSISDYSGEWFRDDILIPLLEKHNIVEFDFTYDEIAGCPPGWIEEVFGGIIRKGYSPEQIIFIGDNEYVRKAKIFMTNADEWQSGNAADC